MMMSENRKVNDTRHPTPETRNRYPILRRCSESGLRSSFGFRISGFGFRSPAFTLIELMLVMALLTIVLSVSAPSLARFFRGRSLDSEARRFLALTRYGQSRAASEGIPMLLWIDAQQRTYGLEAERSYVEQDGKAVGFELASNLVVEVEQPMISLLASQTRQGRWTPPMADNRPTIRFTPDGYIGETSPERVVIRQVREGEEDAVLIGLSQTRLNYEIQTNQPPLLRR